MKDSVRMVDAWDGPINYSHLQEGTITKASTGARSLARS